jgi:hypothetical protein
MRKLRPSPVSFQAHRRSILTYACRNNPISPLIQNIDLDQAILGAQIITCVKSPQYANQA